LPYHQRQEQTKTVIISSKKAKSLNFFSEKGAALILGVCFVCEGFPVGKNFILYRYVFILHSQSDFFSLINTASINQKLLHSLGQIRKHDRFTPRGVVYAMFRRELNSILQA